MANSLTWVLLWISTFINIYTTKVWIPFIPVRAIASVARHVGEIKALAVRLTSEGRRILRRLVASLVPNGPVEHRGDQRPIPHATEILLTESEGLLFDYEGITAGIEAPHVGVVVQAVHAGVVVEEHVGYRGLAAPDPVAHPVFHVLHPGAHREAAAREAPAVGSGDQAERVAPDGREPVLGAGERERGEDHEGGQGLLLLSAGLGVAVLADVGVDAEFAIERYVEDFDVGLP